MTTPEERAEIIANHAMAFRYGIIPPEWIAVHASRAELAREVNELREAVTRACEKLDEYGMPYVTGEAMNILAPFINKTEEMS